MDSSTYCLLFYRLNFDKKIKRNSWVLDSSDGNHTHFPVKLHRFGLKFIRKVASNVQLLVVVLTDINHS